MRLNLIDRLVTLSITLALVGSVALRAGADKGFQVGPAAEYAHQESEKVTVGAKAYVNEDLVTSAFGKKIDFPKYGVVPVLVVIQNKRDQALDLRRLEASLVAMDGRHVNPVSPDDLPGLATTSHPSQTRVPVPVPLPKKKNPLNAPEIGMRALSAEMLAPGDSASGFLYFEAKPEAGDKLYVNGMRDARSGQELLYFEFPFDKQP